MPIAFADSTRSVIRCVQALGRALRLDVSGKTASLIVPVCVPPGADGESILGAPYEPVWAIACALADRGHRILERLPDKANRLPRETSDVIQRRWHFDFTVHPERIAQAMDLASFDPREAAVSRSRRGGLAAAQPYRDQYGHLAVRQELSTQRADALTALDADWRLPHGADWHRKCGLLRVHLATGAGLAALTRHPPGRGEDRFLAAPPAHHLAHPGTPWAPASSTCWPPSA